MLTYILISTVLISGISLVSVLMLSIKKDLLKTISEYLVALSAGTMIGTALLHLLPESLELLEFETVFTTVLFAFTAFFILEKLIHWHHCHTIGKHQHKSTLGHMNLIGDAFHNFIDGLIVAASFILNTQLGILTSIAVAIHELPQEISDFGVLTHAGWDKARATKANVLVSTTMILGGVIGYYLTQQVEGLIPYFTAFAAGGFIYISATDLVPELKAENDLKKSFFHLAAFILGVYLTTTFHALH